MDGAIPAFNADPTRRIAARFQLSSGASTAQSMQSGLFEQLLSMPAPARVQQQRDSSTSRNASDADPLNSSSNKRSSDSTSATEANSNDRDDQHDVKSTAEKEAEQGAVEDQVALLTATPAAATPTDEPSEDSGLTGAALDSQDSKAAQTEQQPSDAGQASQSSAVAATAAASEADDGLAGQQPTASTASDEQVAELPAVQAPAGATADGGEQPQNPSQSSLQIQADGSDQSDASVELPHSQEQGTSQSDPSLQTQATPAAGQVANATDDEGKSRGQRREKWYERSGDNASPTFGTHDDASPGATAATSQVSAASDAVGADDATNSATDSTAVLPQPVSSDSLDASQLPVGVSAITSAEPLAASVAASVASSNSVDSTGAVDGESGTASSSGREGIDSKGNSSTTPRADAKASANEAQRPDVLTHAERVRLVQRVSRSFARLGPMGGQVNIKLHPPQLGALNVQVRMEGRTMTAKLTTESSAARDVILESLPVLRGRLAEQGFEISSFQVEVADNNADPTSGNGNPQAAYDQSSGGNSGNQAGQGVDYRRLAAQQRSRSDGLRDSSLGGAPRAVAWQMLAGVDLQA